MIGKRVFLSAVKRYKVSPVEDTLMEVWEWANILVEVLFSETTFVEVKAR